MKKMLLSLLLGQVSVLKGKINQAMMDEVSKLSEPKNVSLIEAKKDELIANAVSLMPVQVKIFYNIPFVKDFIDSETDDALSFLIRSLKSMNLTV